MQRGARRTWRPCVALDAPLSRQQRHAHAVRRVLPRHLRPSTKALTGHRHIAHRSGHLVSVQHPAAGVSPALRSCHPLTFPTRNVLVRLGQNVAKRGNLTKWLTRRPCHEQADRCAERHCVVRVLGLWLPCADGRGYSTGQITVATLLAALGLFGGLFAYLKLVRISERKGYAKPSNRMTRGQRMRHSPTGERSDAER